MSKSVSTVLAAVVLVLGAQRADAQAGPWGDAVIGAGLDGASFVVAADIDGDGDVDALTASPDDDTVAWHENTAGDGSAWTNHEITTSLGGAKAVVAADMDGDGDLDACAAGLTDDVIVWYENGLADGSPWIPRIVSFVPNAPQSVFVADMDGDGDLDALSASQGDSRVRWYESSADGMAWSVHVVGTMASAAFSVVAADMDGDGDPDVVAALLGSDTVLWYENVAGDASTWTPRTITSTAVDARAVVAADVDGDGDLDVVSASTGDNTIAWHENTSGDGTTWSSQVLTASAVTAIRVFAADVDQDGDQDVLSASAGDDTVAWHENVSGDGSSWVEHVISSDMDGANSVVVADVDGDGLSDVLATASSAGSVEWYENQAAPRPGTVCEVPNVVSAPDAWTFDWFRSADIDRDGDLDVVGKIGVSAGDVWLENAAGDGSTWSTHSLGIGLAGLGDVGDLDGDGDTDLVTACNAICASVDVVTNDAGDGSAWSSTSLPGLGSTYTSVTTGDLDEDGDLDVVTTSVYGTTVAWYENLAGDASSWTGHGIALAGFVTRAALVTDLDVDGDPDVVVASDSDPGEIMFGAIGGAYTLLWYENRLQTEGFLVERDIVSGEGNAFAVAVADLDEDGDPDLISQFEGAFGYVWYENTLGDASAWTEHTIEEVLGTGSRIDTADLDRDGDRDVLVAKGGVGPSSVGWYENTTGEATTWAYHELVETNTFLWTESVEAADVDGDGDRDVLWLQPPSGPGLVWFENLSVEASVSVRVGEPANPAALLPGEGSPPRLGEAWLPVIDHTGFMPTAVLDFFYLGTAPVNIPFSAGTILSFPPVVTFVAPAGVPFFLVIPEDCTLLGALLTWQGVSWDGSDYELTNALDTVIGTY